MPENNFQNFIGNVIIFFLCNDGQLHENEVFCTEGRVIKIPFPFTYKVYSFKCMFMLTSNIKLNYH